MYSIEANILNETCSESVDVIIMTCVFDILSQEQQTVDPFVIYNPLYSILRECVNEAMYGKQFQQLKKSTKVGAASNTICTVKEQYGGKF